MLVGRSDNTMIDDGMADQKEKHATFGDPLQGAFKDSLMRELGLSALARFSLGGGVKTVKYYTTRLAMIERED
jgi:hypothetical protein